MTTDVTGRDSNQLNYHPAGGKNGWRRGDRTPDPRINNPSLYRLSYAPFGLDDWWDGQGSNLRLSRYEQDTLTN